MDREALANIRRRAAALLIGSEAGKTMTREQLLAWLTQRFAAVGHGMVFEVVADGVRQDGAWWYVPVLATRNGQDVAREFAVNLFAQVEDELNQQHGLNVLLVPVVNEPARN